MPEKVGVKRTSRTPRILAEFSSSQLRANFQKIQRLVPLQEIIPMIKANAYGHGYRWTVSTLLEQKSLARRIYGFGVASLEEGAAVRKVLGNQNHSQRIIVFSGATPWADHSGNFCRKHGLEPVITSSTDWERFLSSSWARKVRYHLKFNTGMNRLGIETSAAAGIVRSLRHRNSHWYPQSVLSHLAMGESPRIAHSRKQLRLFKKLRSEFESLSHSLRYHFANSAGIWHAKDWELHQLSDIVRPGIALYGVPPWTEAPSRGIRPAMTLKTWVISTTRLGKGDSVGYGARYTAKKREWIATCSAGYGDGVPRQLSSSGSAWHGGKKHRILGTISMDLLAVSATPTTRPGQEVELLGKRIDPWKQAEACETIPYELLTSLTERVERKYDGKPADSTG